ncbi:MAG: TldD/PmbA family protein [Candidatus Thermoplasmatota archaeon]|nr:TldD/PmbA family protein [Candidatus Thermoplasmatota archaeon]MBS3789661.1 TldD/PmbA family protein [Candidatus Thermoplasmatota archaeon]
MIGERYDHELLKLAVETAMKAGAHQAIAKLVEKKNHQIRFSNSSIDVNKEWVSYHLDVFLSKKPTFSLTGKIDTVTIQDPTSDKIKSILPKQVNHLDSLPKIKFYWGMEEDTADSYPSLDLYDPGIERFHNKAPKLVKTTINSAEEAGAEDVAGVLHSKAKKIGLLTSYGNGGVYKTSHCRQTVRSFCDEESSGQSVVVSKNLSDIEKKFKKAGQRSGNLARRCTEADQGKPGSYDLIMSPTVGANVLGNLLNGANPITMLGGMSCLKGKMNESIGPNELSVIDDPLIEKGMKSRPFDDEGRRSEKTALIDKGEFINMIHNTSTANLWRFLKLIKLKFWKRPTSTSNSELGQIGMTGTEENPRTLLPSPSNYRFKAGSYSLEEMISSSTKPTIYLTSNWYTRFTNMREGEFSTVPRDAMFLIKDGEIKKPLRDLRLKGNLLDMCEKIEAIGEDLKQIKWWEVDTPTIIPHIKVKDCKFTKAKS